MLVAPPESVLVNLLDIYCCEMYRDTSDIFLHVSSCPMCFTLLLKLGRGNGKDNRHYGGYLHPTIVPCLYQRCAGKGKVKNGNGKETRKNAFLSFFVPLNFDTPFSCLWPKS